MSVDNYYKVLVCPETVSEEQLHYLVEEACEHPSGSVQRQKNLTAVIRLISKKLWKENTPYYQDALQQTWLYFCQNICEGITGKPYDPNRSSIATWLNFYLKQRLHDFYIRKHKEEFRTAATPIEPLESGNTHSTLNRVETIPAKPDVPPLLEEVTTWVETDPEGELRRIHITHHPEVTCQVLILRRLPPETSWKTLSQEFNLPISTLSSFYQHKCLPCLRKFGQSQGYI
ncbi:MAG: sigma-70 family RNA polymerase sigma factor [Cyanobacteriota bacterium]